MTRDEALSLVREYVKNEGLVRHMLSVEASMRFYAEKFDEDVERWGLIGLLHDFDWEIHPSLEGHPQDGAPILRERGVSEPRSMNRFEFTADEVRAVTQSLISVATVAERVKKFALEPNRGDIILAVNNQDVKSLEQFTQLMGQFEKGKIVAMLVRRGANALYILLEYVPGGSIASMVSRLCSGLISGTITKICADGS